MMKNLDELLRVVQGPGPGALVIGFDGTAALLGHPDHYALSDQVRGNRSSQDLRELISAEVRERPDPYERYQYLRDITTPRAGRQAGTAIQVIASLLSENHVNVVVATDPHRTLYTAIAQYVPNLNWVAGDGFTDTHVESFLRDQQGRRIFFDAGGTLIRGFQDGIREEFGRAGPQASYLKQMVTRLQDFLGSYEKVFCWGWCRANVPFYVICPNGAQPTVHAIGAYTDCGDIDNTFFTYDVGRLAGGGDDGQESGEPSGAGRTTTVALERMAAALALSPDAVPVGVGARSDLPGISAPLLSEDALNTFVRPLDLRSDVVHIVGIENQTVRRSAANWLYRKVMSMGEPGVLQEGWALDELGRFLSLQTTRSTSQHIVGCFTAVAEPLPGESEWQPKLQAMLRYWVSQLNGEVRRGHRITLFCPMWMSQWIGKAQIADRQLKDLLVESYSDSAVIKESIIQEWLWRSLGRFSAGIGKPDIDLWASRIAGLSQTDPYISPSVIPEVLSFWVTWLNDCQTALPDGRALSVMEIAGELEGLKGAYHAVSDILGARWHGPDDGWHDEDEAPPAQPIDPGLDWELRPQLRPPPAQQEPAAPGPEVSVPAPEPAVSVPAPESEVSVPAPEPPDDWPLTITPRLQESAPDSENGALRDDRVHSEFPASHPPGGRDGRGAHRGVPERHDQARGQLRLGAALARRPVRAARRADAQGPGGQLLAHRERARPGGDRPDPRAGDGGQRHERVRRHRGLRLRVARHRRFLLIL